MATNFPANLDALTNPSATDRVSAVSHSSQHANANDAIEALEAKVGKDGSAVTTSHDYKLSSVSGSDKAASQAGEEALTNKTIDGNSNTITILQSQITGAPTGAFVGTTDEQALTNKTLTSPKIVTALLDANGNEAIKIASTAGAVNEITVTNGSTGNNAQITATGGDANIGISIQGKGTGAVALGAASLKFPNADGSADQYVKTDGSGTLSFGSPAGALTDKAFTYGETIAVNDLLYLGVDGKAYKLGTSQSLMTQANYIGFAKEAGNINDSKLVQMSGVVAGFLGLRTGTLYYPSSTAGLITASEANANKVYVGRAISATEIAMLRDYSSHAQAASSTLQLSNDAQHTVTTGTYTKVKELAVTQHLSGYRVSFDIGHSDGGNTYGRVYKNGVAIGTERVESGGITLTTYSEDFANAVPGDLIQLYVKNVGGSPTNAIYANFRLYFTDTPTALGGANAPYSYNTLT